MSDLKLVFTIKQVSENEEVIGELRFDKDIKKSVFITNDEFTKYFSSKVEEIILDMDEKKLIEYKWKEAVLKANKIDASKK